MKDEIKEILNQLEIVARKHTIEVCEDGSKIETMSASVVDELRLNNYSSKLLLDYITNLQEENEKLIKLKEKYQLKKEVYKQRNEKAINYINIWLVDEYSIAVPSKEEPDVFCEYEPNAIEKLLNILNGDDE